MEPERGRVKPLIATRQHRLFTDEPVGDGFLSALTEVARWSGSSRNTQPWRFLVIRDVALIREIADVGHPQTRSLHTAMAAIAIVMREDEARAVSLAYDEGRAAERMLVAATMLDIGAGIAWITSAVRPAVSQLLALPEGSFVRTIIAVGHPSAEGRARRSAPGTARLPRNETVIWDRFE
jgi:nitroreductase